MPHGRRIWIALIAAAVLLLGGLPLALYLYDLHWQHRLEEKEDELRAQGLPVTVAEFRAQRDVPPPDENSALIFQDLIDLLEGTRAEDAADVASTLTSAVGFGRRPSDGTLALVRRCMQENADALAIIRRGAQLRRGAYPLGPNPGPAMLMPHLSPLRSAAELCVAEATVRTAEGDPAGAAAGLRNARGLAASLDEPSCLIEGLVRIAIDAIAVDGMERFLALRELPPDALVMLREELQAGQTQLSLADAWRGELALFYEPVFKNPGLRAMLGGSPNAGFGALHMIPGLLEQNAVFYLDLMAPVVRLSELSSREKLAEGRKLEKQVQLRLNEASRRYLLASMLVPAFRRSVEVEVNMHARFQVAGAALAAEQWRMAHGAWPESLDALVPELLPAVPEDPFSDGKIRYVLTDTGVVLYSVGADGEDDGGRGHEEMKAELGPRTDKADIRFRLLDPDRRGAKTTTLREDLTESGLELEDLEKAGITKEDLQALGLSPEALRQAELFGRWGQPAEAMRSP